MLTAEEIRALIVCRQQALAEGAHDHVMHQIRGLVAALTGQMDPPCEVAELLTAAGIPHTVITPTSWAFHADVSYPAEWILAHGFTIDGDPKDPESKIHHPRFSEGW